jgi:hypothetical protein
MLRVHEPLPHAASRPVHWFVVSAALAAVVGGALAVAPAQGALPVANGTAPATPAPHGVPHALPAASAPDAARATLPLDCGGVPVKITQSFAADLRGDGTASTVVTAHCDTPAGTPPDGVYILQNGAGGAPRVAFTLVSPKDDLTVLSVALRSDGTLQATASGYSSADVPRCCPDLHENLVWTPQGSGWSRSSTLPGTSI